MSDETKNVTLKSTFGAKVYPTATLDQLIADKDNSSSYVTRGGVIKREYLPREITVLIGCFDSAPDLDEVQNNDRYYNTTTKKVAVCWTNSSGEKEWSEGVPEQDRMFLDLSTACLMFFHDNDMYMCNSENASSLTSGVVVDSATNANTAVLANNLASSAAAAIVNSAVGEADIAAVKKELSEARFVEANPWSSATTQNAFTLLHFSDIHNDVTTMNRIVAKATALSPNIDAMICTGDMREVYQGEISSWWDPNIMTCIGNHECRNEAGSSWTALSMANRDAYYIAPFQSHWGTIVHTAGTSYYYKDWSAKKVRLIVIDCVLYNSTNPTPTEAAGQTTWLTNALQDAIDKGLHVIIAAHAIYQGAVNRQCSFSKYKQPFQRLVADTQIPLSVVQLVATKINAGLHFIGYICGHYHQDGVWDALGDGTQLMYAVTCAVMTPANLWQNYSDQYRGTDYDAFNLITVDTTNYRMKIVRGGGANVDTRMRKRDMISIQYDTHTIIDEEITEAVSENTAGWHMKGESGKLGIDRYVATDVVTGTSLTLQAGHAYKFTAYGTVTLSLESSPMDSYGLEGMLDVTLSGGTLSAGTGVILADTLSANARNICSVHYLDGRAVVKVLTVISTAPPVSGYIVVSATGTANGSLYYGLATSTESEIHVSSTLDGQTLDMGGAVTNAAKTVYGNGYGYTTISGGVSCTSKTEFSGVSMDGVTVLGGTMSATNVDIPAGATVAVASGGYLVPRNVQGSGVIDLRDNHGGASTYVWPKAPVMTEGGDLTMAGVTISGAVGARGLYAACDTVNLTSCVITGATAATTVNQYDAGYAQNGGSATITGCAFTNNKNDHIQFSGAGIHIYGGGIATVIDSDISYNHGEGWYSSSVDSYGGGNGGGGINVNLKNTSATVFSNCIITGNTAQHGIGGGCFFTGGSNGGYCEFHDCLFTSNFAGGMGGAVGAINAATVSLTGCTMTAHGGPASVAGVTQSAVILMSSCVISGNSAYNAYIYVHDGTVSLVDTVISGNANAQYGCLVNGHWGAAHMHCSNTLIGYNSADPDSSGVGTQVGITSGGVVYLHGGNTIGITTINNNGSAVVEGTNDIVRMRNTAGAASVIISSGASISLTSSIQVSANGITVLDGGCVVNGANIPAGTYTQIVSSGGSAVAS